MFRIPEPEVQVAFARLLVELRKTMLQDALRQTIKSLDIPTLDKQLAQFVPSHSLGSLAASGLRGELVFAVPLTLENNPRLLGYYRLLYGFSQKEFFKNGVAGQFKSMEVAGKLTKKNASALPDLCKSMAEVGAMLLAGMAPAKVEAALLDDLTLITLGPQLRGRANVTKGVAAIAAVFGVIREIVAGSIDAADQSRIKLTNAAGRNVIIEFAADPDIVIREEMRSGSFRDLIAIEVKGGRDFSNVHNRIGEAEKSHQKARASGFVECWTVVNVDNIDIAMAKRESPSTNRFYRISDLISAAGSDYDDFHDRVVSLTGTRK